MSKEKEKSLREEIPDLSVDREQSFSNSFEDPAMDEMLPNISLDLSVSEGPSIVAEAAEAVHELMLDASSEEADLNSLLELPASAENEMAIEPGLDVAADANLSFGLEASGEATMLMSRAEMADRLFSLVACERSFPDLVEDILVSLQQSVCAEAGSILEFDHERNEFFFRASVGGGAPEKVKAFRVPAMKGIVGHVAASRQGLLLKSLESDEKQLQAISMSSGFETRTCIAAPILIQNQLFGVIELFNKLSADHFDERDLQVLEEGARMASKVLEVRFLVSELARRKR